MPDSETESSEEEGDDSNDEDDDSDDEVPEADEDDASPPTPKEKPDEDLTPEEKLERAEQRKLAGNEFCTFSRFVLSLFSSFSLQPPTAVASFYR